MCRSLLLYFLLTRLDSEESVREVKLDISGAVLCSLGLAATVFGLIEQPRYGWSPAIITSIVVGILLLIAFVYKEKTNKTNAMLDLSLFKIRNFTVGNLATIAIYGGLSVATFIIVIFLQQVDGYSALKAGLSLLPVTIIMFGLSPRWGALASKFGPRLFMIVGPMVAAAGFLLMRRVGDPVSYTTQLLPAVILFAIGLSMTVSPLTSAVLRDVDKKENGIASAVNNAISRIAGLITIAVVGVLVGTTLTLNGFHTVIIFTAVLLFCGGIISLIGIRNSKTI
ncbi:MAG: MFS transporter [Candidatus Saccharibacteria bacterium]